MKNELALLYQDINRHGQDAINQQSEQIDRWINHSTEDHRRSLTLIATVPAHVSRNIKFCLQDLRQKVPELYYYPSKTFHLTIMDLYRGYPAEQLQENYVQELQSLIKSLLPIQWTLSGFIASPGAILAKGYYSSNLTKLRNLIRQQMSSAGLPLMERYPTISGHMTVARFPRQLEHRQEIVHFINQNSELQFGTFQVEELTLVIHDWYHRHVQKVVTFSNR